MQRRDYNELSVLGQQGLAAPAEVCNDILAREYPKSTTEAATELRTRGLHAKPTVLDYLIKKGVIPAPAGEGRNRKWTAETIDAGAEYMDAEGTYTPGAVALMMDNIDPAQDVRAQRQAFRKNPDLPPDASCFVKTVKPGAAGLGIYATVSYRRMTAKEQAEWEARVAEVQKAQRRGGRHA